MKNNIHVKAWNMDGLVLVDVHCYSWEVVQNVLEMRVMKEHGEKLIGIPLFYVRNYEAYIEEEKEKEKEMREL